MRDLHLFAGLAVRDYPRAVAWYESLLGVPATFHAHETECVWTLADDRSIYVVLEPDHAGHAMITAFLGDLDGFVEGAAGRGIEPHRQEAYGDGVRKIIYRDPDGNEIGFGGGPRETRTEQ